jgi:hypothetical protein
MQSLVTLQLSLLQATTVTTTFLPLTSLLLLAKPAYQKLLARLRTPLVDTLASRPSPVQA